MFETVANLKIQMKKAQSIIELENRTKQQHEQVLQYNMCRETFANLNNFFAKPDLLNNKQKTADCKFYNPVNEISSAENYKTWYDFKQCVAFNEMVDNMQEQKIVLHIDDNDLKEFTALASVYVKVEPDRVSFKKIFDMHLL
jgi:hypothetical protein